MNETDIAVKLENHDQQIKSLKHRMEEQEEQSKTIQELVLSVKEQIGRGSGRESGSRVVGC